MHPRHRIILLLTLVIIVAGACSSTTPEACTEKIISRDKGIHLAVEKCKNIGTYSLGGLYDGVWEKLTYNYPKPWPGTFLSVRVDDRIYTTSNQPQDGTQMDEHMIEKPHTVGDSIKMKWTLPEKIAVEQTLTLTENTSNTKITINNQDTKTHEIEVRHHIDTMLGVNDGAPIYVPGDGLKTAEKEYTGGSLNFKYFKAYNRPENPTIVATGMIDPELGLTHPTKIILADWKKSKNTALQYPVDSRRPIVGDSSVLLFYGPKILGSGEAFEIVFAYGSRGQVLPPEKGLFGITEVLVDEVLCEYCPGQDVTLTVDVLSSKTPNEGLIYVEVSDGKKIIFNQTLATGLIDSESMKSFEFSFTLPDSSKRREYNVLATLTNKTGGEIDSIRKSNLFKLDPDKCLKKKGVSMWWLVFAAMAAFVILALIVILYIILSKKGKIILTKHVQEGVVAVKVENRTRKPITNCVVEDKIPTQAEVDISTIDVIRRGSRLIWDIGEVAAGETALLEYKIRGVNVLPPARASWDGGEEVSN